MKTDENRNEVIVNVGHKENLKLLYKWVKDNNLIEVVKPYIFNNNADIETIYKIEYDYYINYGKIPKYDVIKTKLIELGEEGLFSSTYIMLEKIKDFDVDFYKPSFINWIRLKDIEYKLKYSIEDVRKAQNYLEPELIEKLIDDYNINDTFSLDGEDETIEDELELFDESIYSNLPSLLKNMADHFEDRNMKDLFLISELTILSVLFENVYGIYDGKKSFSNLYSLIISDSAGGKSDMNYAKDTLFIIEKELTELNRKLEESSEVNFKEKYIRLAGDNSAAGFLMNLEENGGSGLIYQTEIDTLINSSKQDWGNYSDKLREAFHHETICQYRKGGEKKGKRINIVNPKLSVLMSGTKDQVVNFIGSSQNGFFSRFNYYIFSGKNEWKDVFKRDENGNIEDKEGIFRNKYGKKVYELYEYYKNEKEYTFSLTKEQETKFNERFKSDFFRTIDYDGDGALSIIKRLGVKIFRILMILTIIRNKEIDIFNNNTKLICSDIDFNIGLKMIDVFLKHSLIVYRNLNNDNNVVFKVKNHKERLYEEMTNIFSKNQIIKAAEKYDKLGKRTIEALLTTWKNTGRIVKVDRFNYKKVK